MSWVKKIALATAISTAASCGPMASNNSAPTETTAPQPKGPITHEGLKKLQNSGVRFIGEDGKEVDLSDIQKQIDTTYSTISFMFGSCPVECPKSVGVLQQLSTQDQNTTHIVIATLPSDFNAPGEAGSLRYMVNNNFGKAGPLPKTILLFPTAHGTYEDLKRWQNSPLMASTPEQETAMQKGIDSFHAQVVDAQLAVGVLPPTEKSNRALGTHSLIVQLYSPKGKKLGEAMNNDQGEIQTELLDKMVPLHKTASSSIQR